MNDLAALLFCGLVLVSALMLMSLHERAGDMPLGALVERIQP